MTVRGVIDHRAGVMGTISCQWSAIRHLTAWGVGAWEQGVDYVDRFWAGWVGQVSGKYWAGGPPWPTAGISNMTCAWYEMVTKRLCLETLTICKPSLHTGHSNSHKPLCITILLLCCDGNPFCSYLFWQ